MGNILLLKNLQVFKQIKSMIKANPNPVFRKVCLCSFMSNKNPKSIPPTFPLEVIDSNGPSPSASFDGAQDRLSHLVGEGTRKNNPFRFGFQPPRPFQWERDGVRAITDQTIDGFGLTLSPFGKGKAGIS